MGLVERGWLLRARVQAGCERAGARVCSRWRGQSTVEYALVGALVVIAAAAAMTALGDQVTNVFSKITHTLSGAATPGN
jgi:Flp pilus assembly pilin Flp